MPTNPIVNSRVFIHNPTPLRVAMRMSVNGGYPSSHMLEPGEELYFDGGPHPAFAVEYDAEFWSGDRCRGIPTSTRDS